MNGAFCLQPGYPQQYGPQGQYPGKPGSYPPAQQPLPSPTYGPGGQRPGPQGPPYGNAQNPYMNPQMNHGYQRQPTPGYNPQFAAQQQQQNFAVSPLTVYQFVFHLFTLSIKTTFRNENSDLSRLVILDRPAYGLYQCLD